MKGALITSLVMGVLAVAIGLIVGCIMEKLITVTVKDSMLVGVLVFLAGVPLNWGWNKFCKKMDHVTRNRTSFQ
jgi:vacuolar-type H+-ATPase subunit I/STV1